MSNWDFNGIWRERSNDFPILRGFEYVFGVDIAPPGINFTSPTLSSGTTTMNTSVQINISITNASDLNEFKWNWNGTNTTFYDDSLVLMMNFDNVSALGENDTAVKDLSKYGNNGTVTGAAWNTSGKYGGAMNFDGSNDYVLIPDSDIIELGSKNFTIMFWAITRSTKTQSFFDWGFGSDHSFGFTYNLSGTGTLGLWASSNGGSWDMITCDGGGAGNGIITFPQNQWVFVVINRAGDNFSYYQNNVLDKSISVSGTIVNKGNSKVIGEWFNTGQWDYNGTIDEFRIYNRSLSQAEITQLYYSNLNKYASDKWAFISNQTNFTKQTYTYQAFAKDTNGNTNQTEQRSLLWGDYVVPGINFTNPTLQNGTTTANTSVQINISITNAADMNEFKLNWNGTNTTFYDDSLVLMMNFDNVSSLGENSTKIVGIDHFSNNGTAMNGAFFNSSGKYGGAYQFDGNNDFINTTINASVMGLGGNNCQNPVSACLWVYFITLPSDQGTLLDIGGMYVLSTQKYTYPTTRMFMWGILK